MKLGMQLRNAGKLNVIFVKSECVLFLLCFKLLLMFCLGLEVTRNTEDFADS